MMATVTLPTIETRNPATGTLLRVHRVTPPAEIETRLDDARAAAAAWRSTDFDERAKVLHRVAAYLRDEKARIAAIATAEMGKPIAEAEAEVEKCALCCDFYADRAREMLADEHIPSNARRSYVAFRPLGIVLAVMPWNFPFWQVFRFAAPALMAGNAGVLKHAANVSECALEIERVFEACELPRGLFNTLLIRSQDVEAIVRDRRIAAVTLTGSEAAGAAVASAAGAVLKKTVLELGGSDAFIVLADADVESAAKTAARARFQNTGQSCIAAKRFIVEAPVYEQFIDAFAIATKLMRVGDPLDRATQIGPLAREDLRDALQQQIDDSLRAGARLVIGGKALPGPGYFFEPTILADVEPAMPVFSEETFGPAAAVIRADDLEHAVGLANASEFGLGGNLWTRDIDRAEKIAARLESGAVFINGMTASDPRLPFGGVKRSGYGRELSHYGIKEFVNIQTVWIGPAQEATQGPPAE
jgi:succinate-semialdehyde dehydrogenase/glutarate-semialdehyde dehydrogenase